MRLDRNAVDSLLLGACLVSLCLACRPRSANGPEKGSSPKASLPPTPHAAADGPPKEHPNSREAPLNPWSGAAREVLSQHCGSCHRGDLPTAVPAALAVFNLLEDPWYGRLAPKQYDGVLIRIRGTKAVDPADGVSVERFVHCARDGACEAGKK